jgi:uncharacterized protein (UPF0147 family)
MDDLNEAVELLDQALDVISELVEDTSVPPYRELFERAGKLMERTSDA